jgi:hypothetical protein
MPGDLSQHFSRKELENSETAVRHGIDNRLPDEWLPVWQRACLNLLEPIRTAAHKALFVRSGFRCEQVNTMIGGSKNSQHRGLWTPQGANQTQLCAAFDLEITGGANPNLKLFNLIRAQLISLPVDQMIWEFGEEEPNWVHVSFVPPPQQPRRSLLRARTVNGIVVYTPMG